MEQKKEQKQCNRCKKMLDIENFAKYSNDRLRKYCISCNAKYRARRNDEKKAENKEKAKQKYEQNKEAINAKDRIRNGALILCICGREYRADGLARHQRTKIHAERLNDKNEKDSVNSVKTP